MTCQHPKECKDGNRCLWCESLDQAKIDAVGMNVKELFDGLAKVSNAYLSERMCLIEEQLVAVRERLELVTHRAAENFGDIKVRLENVETVRETELQKSRD